MESIISRVVVYFTDYNVITKSTKLKYILIIQTMEKFILQTEKEDVCMDNVFTLRLNPFHKGTPLYTIKHISKIIDGITKIYTYMIFKEVSKNLIKHLHIYITTSLSMRRIQQIIKEQLPLIKGSDKSTHVCYEKGVLHDSNLWKSKTYIAKDGCLIKQRGFTSTEIKEFYRIGSTLQKLAKDRTAVYKQIISIYSLDKGTPFIKIVEAVYNYYDTYRGRKYPNWKIIDNLITQIKNNLNEKYFQYWKAAQIDRYRSIKDTGTSDDLHEPENVYNQFL